MALADAAAGAQQALYQMLEQRMLQAKFAEDQRQAQAEEAARSRGLDISEGQLDISRRNLGVSQGNLDLSRQRLENEIAQQNAPPPPVSLAGSSRLVDPTTGRIIVATEPDPADNSPVTLSAGAGLIDPMTGRIIAKMPFAPQNDADEPLHQIMGPAGTPIWVRRSQAVGQPAAQAPRAVTGSERTTLGFFNRMLEAEKNARRVEDQLSGRDLGAQQYAPGWLENWLQSQEGQAYTQAQRMYTEARLRKESGAAIPQSEFETDRKTNFRIAGDKPELLSQKRRSRVQTMRGLGSSAGKAIQEYYGEGATLDDLLKEFEEAGGGAQEFDYVNGKLVPRSR